MSSEKQNQKQKPSLLRVIASTMAAFIGIQNDENRERDFQQKSIIPYMLVGIVLAAIFIIGLVFIAKQLDPGA